MNIPRLIRRIKAYFSNRQQDSRKRERFLTNVLQTRAFLRLSLQDKILSLGKLMMVFSRDFGYVPSRVQKTFDKLNGQLNDRMKQSWNELYA